MSSITAAVFLSITSCQKSSNHRMDILMKVLQPVPPSRLINIFGVSTAIAILRNLCTGMYMGKF